MAVWGKGDPRWIVEERPDATNVNNWHWIERNAANWSKEKFKEILIGTQVETDFAKCNITEITKCVGDAVVNNRKAKIIIFYEWTIHLKWVGALINGDTEVKGTMEIFNLSEEYDMKDVDIIVRLESTGPESEIIKDMMNKAGGEVIRRQLSVYVTSLREEFSKGLILPTKDAPEEKFEDVPPPKKIDVASIPEVKGYMVVKELVDIKSSDTFKCSAEELYRALTVKELIDAFTYGECVMDAKEGGKFEMFDKNVMGHFTKLVPYKYLEQKWRFRSWPPGFYSDVQIRINQTADSTEVNVIHCNIPKRDVDCVEGGWKKFYWNSIKKTFGYGALLL